MPVLYGRPFSKEDLYRYVGHLHQIAGIHSFIYNEGKADGTKAIRIDNGVLSLTLLPSRCLDVLSASWQGIPLGYFSKSGVRHPAYFVENAGKGFNDNFFGGLLTTSGLNNIGAPSICGDLSYGAHGEMTNIPADLLSCEESWDGDELTFSVKASMHHSRFYGEDILFTRHLTTRLGESYFTIHDRIENLDFRPFPLFLLYHINFGFPLLDENARMILPEISSVEPRTEDAAPGLPLAASFSCPEDEIEEECFYYSFKKKEIKIALENPGLGKKGIRAYLCYDAEQFPVFTEWKMMRSREYVCGFAPGTNRLEGRAKALADENVRYLAPMETVDYVIRLGVEEL